MYIYMSDANMINQGYIADYFTREDMILSALGPGRTHVLLGVSSEKDLH